LEPVELLQLVELSAALLTVVLITLLLAYRTPLALLAGKVALLNLELLQRSSAVIARQRLLQPGALVEMATSALGLPVPETL
jgi:hypothetical protein